jgi:hypothetical protein
MDADRPVTTDDVFINDSNDGDSNDSDDDKDNDSNDYSDDIDSDSDDINESNNSDGSDDNNNQPINQQSIDVVEEYGTCQRR